jgi:amino acid adenylation domain-containing protein
MRKEETMSIPEPAVQERAPEDQREYWLKKLSFEREHSGLIADYASAGGDAARKESVEAALPPELVRELDRVAANSPFLVYTVLLTALKICLHKYSGSEFIIVGSPARKKQGGLFQRPNALAIVDKVTGDMSFRQLLSNVRETLLEAYAKQSYPYERVLQDLNLESDERRCPLFDIALAFREIHGNLLEVDNHINITFQRAGEELNAVADYDASLYRRESIAGLMQSLFNVLRAGLRNTGAAIEELPLLDEAERRRLLVEWNNTQILHPKDRCIHHLIEAQADATPDAIALILGEESVSYAELDARANGLARHLRKLGVGAEVACGILAGRSIELVVGLLGVLKAGGAYVPLDPSYPQERLALMIEDSGVKVLLTQSALAGTLPERDGLTVVRFDADLKEIESHSRERLESSTHPENIAYIIFTSGSTGRPKGTMVSHRALVSRALTMIKSWRINGSDRLLQFVTLSFDASIQEIVLSLVSGAGLVLHPNPTELSAAELLQLCEDQGVTTLGLPPAYWHQVVDELSVSRRSIPKWLRLMLSGGDSVSMQRLATWARLAKHPTTYVNGYGPTEATVTATYYEMPLDDAETLLKWARLPIGKPLEETEVYVLDNRQQPVPVGVEGELYLGGEGLARGYVNEPQQTAALFLPHPFSTTPGARLYRTGDHARWLPDGNLEFLGRRDAQVKVRGFRIELGEIESVLLQHATVRQATVLVQPGDAGQPRLVAYVVADRDRNTTSGNGQSRTVSELQEHMRERVPDYMVPSAFIMLDELPLTPNGKVDRRALALIDAAPTPASESDTNFVAARNEAEAKLAEIWRDVLHCEREVGVHDNFFELGGDSILSIQIMARATQAGLKLTPRQLFENPTVAGLAEVALAAEAAGEENSASLESASGEPYETQAAGRMTGTVDGSGPNFPLANLEADELNELIAKHQDVEDIYRLSPMQEAMLFHHLFAPDSEVYFHQISVKLEGKLNLEAFERAWQQIASHHPILRTSFVWEGVKQPVQIVHRENRLRLEHQDWRELDEGEQQKHLNAFVEQERARGFDPSEAPLMRISLIRLAEDAYQFVWSQHHLLLDGWSGLLLLREVFETYEAYRQGRKPETEQPRPYRDYILWLQQQDLAQAEQFWRRVLAGFRAPTPLGMEQPHGASTDAQTGADYEQQYLQLSREATSALRTLARQNELTLNTLVQGAWAFLLSRYSGERDVVFGTVVSGRPAELSGIASMVGLFINTLPVRVQLPPQVEVLAWLQQLQQQQAEAWQYQYSPLVQIRGWSEVPANVPLFESHLVFNNNPADEDAGPLSMSLKVQEPLEAGEEHHPLVLTAALHSQLLLRISYERRRFLSSTITQLLNHLELLLSNLLKQPHAELQTLEEILLTAERQQQAAEAQQLQEISAGKLKSIKRKSGN